MKSPRCSRERRSRVDEQPIQDCRDLVPRTRDSIWQGVSLALGSLADPRVLDAISPGPGEGFDPEAFIRDRGTLFLLATGSAAGASAALVAALVGDLIETARRLAARSAGARLDPPMLLALDEIASLSPLPSLPMLIAEGGGSGITTMPVLQSLAQARGKWNEHQANAIWDASIVKVILGGASNSRDLQDLSALVRERDEYIDSVVTGLAEALDVELEAEAEADADADADADARVRDTVEPHPIPRPFAPCLPLGPGP